MRRLQLLAGLCIGLASVLAHGQTPADTFKKIQPALELLLSGETVEIYNVYADHLDTPRLITNQANQSVWQWDNNDPFGANLPNESPSALAAFEYNLRFPGQYFDKETNTHYNYFRDYDPAIGRYPQTDPLGITTTSRPAPTKRLNHLYSYVGGDPLSKTDPLGLLEDFTFDLRRGQLSSDCSCIAGSVSAFSGNGPYANDPASAHIPFSGPIPPGKYFIVQPYVYTSNPRSTYFGVTFFKLFRDDGTLDDQTFVPSPANPSESIQRGQFRFHPGTASDGCVTLRQMQDWLQIQYQLLNRTKIELLPNGMPYFGTVNVR